jgi:hypothetical protein
MDSELVHLNTLARRLGVPAVWLRREAEAGNLPHIKAGSQLLFDAATVERILLERATRTDARAADRRAPKAHDERFS